MVKLDYDRDYYADLELSATADALEVKKQFKKLGEFSSTNVTLCG
jgi:curved DNA-binding protein CbpA